MKINAIEMWLLITATLTTIACIATPVIMIVLHRRWEKVVAAKVDEVKEMPATDTRAVGSKGKK